MSDTRADDLRTFYSVLAELGRRIGGSRVLRDCDGRMSWPTRGVYFFSENGQKRTDSGAGNRIVRVGTHALKKGSGATLWNRLSQHRGTKRTPGGHHRVSIFRLHVGTALQRQHPELSYPSWGKGSSSTSATRQMERPMEAMVSECIGAMPLLWLPLDDSSGPESERGYIERNSIALLSNFRRRGLDEPAPQWLGTRCASERVSHSGLWNSNHVDEKPDAPFLERLEQLVGRVPAS